MDFAQEFKRFGGGARSDFIVMTPTRSGPFTFGGLDLLAGRNARQTPARTGHLHRCRLGIRANTGSSAGSTAPDS